MYLTYLFVLLVFSFLNVISAYSNLKEKIYYTLNDDEFHMCFKRLNETHQVGCGSNRHGNVGVLFLIDTEDDYVRLKSAPTNRNYVVLMNMSYFNQEVVHGLINMKVITGVLIDYGNASRPRHFSPDWKVPNEPFALQNNTYPFNDFGTGLLFTDIPFPVALLTNATTIEYLRECYHKHNEGSRSDCPWCAVRMKSFMFAAVDAVVCHRRSHIHNNLNPEEYCDPIGSYNLIGSLGPWIDAKPAEGSVILVTARMDALSMFDGISPGFDSSMTGFVALQAVAEIMGRVKHLLRPTFNVKPILFSLFQGESLGYIGSQRFVYDLTHGSIKYLNVTSFGAIIELGQLGVPKTMGTATHAWMHSDKSSCPPSAAQEVDRILRLLSSQAPGIQFAESNHKFPPASIHSFVKHNPNIAAVYISNHRDGFVNKFYNSFLDNNENLEVYVGSDDDDDDNASQPAPESFATVNYIADVAHKVACAVYQLATDSSNCSGVPPANSTFIRDMFYCFGKTSECELFNSTVFESDDLIHAKEDFKRRYTGVHSDYSKNYDATIHRALMVRSLGEKVDMSNCEGLEPKYINGTRYLKFKGSLNPNGTRTPICYKGYVLQPVALSPIYEEDELQTMSNFSSWMESRWVSFGIDVFILPCFMQEMKTLILGFAVVSISLPVILFINYRLLKSRPASQTE